MATLGRRRAALDPSHMLAGESAARSEKSACEVLRQYLELALATRRLSITISPIWDDHVASDPPTEPVLPIVSDGLGSLTGSNGRTQNSGIRREGSNISVTPVVFIVDGEASTRKGLKRLVERSGWQSRAYPSAAEFLAAPRVVAPSCLV